MCAPIIPVFVRWWQDQKVRVILNYRAYERLAWVILSYRACERLAWVILSYIVHQRLSWTTRDPVSRKNNRIKTSSRRLYLLRARMFVNLT